MTRVSFSRHAILRMRRRKISSQLVAKTVGKPNALTRQLHGTTMATRLFRRGRKRYALVVIYRDRHATKHIVTVFSSSKIQKYLRENP